MKLNKILMVLAATAIVGCTSDDLNDFTANQAPEDSRMIQLDPNFAIAGVGAEASGTRTHWYNDGGKLVNQFLPILTGAYAADEVLDTKVDKLNQAVGLCWLGQTPGAEVYTNYQFYHFGWLKQGESSPTLECDKLTNGAWYDEIKFSADGGAANAEPTTGDFAFVDPATKTFAIGDLNYNSGVYKTDNKSIFGGDYIVYYPFNEAFNEVGTIPAKAETSFDAASNNYKALYLGDATFRYSNKIHIDGGAKASGFGLHNLSALVNLKVTGTSNGKIDKIVLWSKKEQLLEQANLAADKILAGKTGKDLYAETKGTKTIVATLATPDEATALHDVNTYITALPTKVEDLVAYVHRADKKWAKITLGEVEFEPNSGKTVTIKVKDGDFKTQFIAVDYASFLTALTEAGDATATIEVIGDITLKSNLTINKPNLTIKGDKIIVPEDITLNLNAKMESDIRVLGKSCCSGAQGGKLFIDGGTIGNVTMEVAEAKTDEFTYYVYNPYVQYTNVYGKVTVAAGKTFDAQAGKIDVDAAVAHKGNINIAEGVKLTVSGTGDLNFMGSTVVNDGTIEVEKAGKFDMTDKDGNATATDGKRMTNNGKFIHNVDAGVGTAVQSMQQNGEYRCKVDKQIKLDDAFLQWTACSVIEMVNASNEIYNLGTGKGVAYKHNNKYIDIEVNTKGGSSATFNNPGDNENIQTGNLTVTKGTLAINFGTDKRSLTVNGNMTVKGNTTIKDSKKITVTENLTVDGATLTYKGMKANVDGLAVTKDITVSDGTFDANEVDAINITCANFYLEEAATATFGNRTGGADKNLVVSGTISNPDGCTFDMIAANQNGAGSVLAWISCKQLNVGGTFTNARPRVE